MPLPFICSCDAYRFPHRPGSGKCNGNPWIQRYFEEDRVRCTTCPNFREEPEVNFSECKVLNGYGDDICPAFDTARHNERKNKK